jgi:ankyrin repeat protein
MGNHSSSSSDEEAEPVDEAKEKVLRLKKEEFINAVQGNQVKKIKQATAHLSSKKKKQIVDGFEGGYKMMATHLACENNFVELLEYLVFEMEADLFKQSSRGNLPLHIAARSNNPKCCEILLKATSDWERSRLLWIAFLKPNDDCMISKMPRDMIRMLHQYSSRNNAEFNKMMLAKNNDNLSPLEYAFKNNARKCLPILITPLTVQSIGIMGNPLHYAAAKGSLEGVQLLLNTKEVYVNALNNRNETPLFRACCAYPECADVVKLLLENGADYGLKATSNSTALIEATNRNYRESAALIRAKMEEDGIPKGEEKKTQQKTQPGKLDKKKFAFIKK